MNVIKVSARSRTAAVAGAIAGVMREVSRAEVQAIGAGAVNQALKAIVIADKYLVNILPPRASAPRIRAMRLRSNARPSVRARQ